MKISDNGINLIKSYEGLSLKATKCVSTEKYYTIGYGHYGSDVKAGQTITKEEALILLKKDISNIETKMDSYQSHYNWNQNQYDALVSFTYNCGIGNLKSLTGSMARTNEQISSMMTAYCKSGGVKLQGLYNRRVKEKKLFNTPVPVDYNQIAKDVIAGKYGNGEARKKALTAAGYDYAKVQEAVNKLLKG